MIKNAETKKKRNPPGNFVVFLLALRCKVRKKKCVYQALSLSLSLSLSPPLEKRARGEGGRSCPWVGPTTPAVISKHPGYHMGTMSDVYRADGRPQGTHRTDRVGS